MKAKQGGFIGAVIIVAAVLSSFASLPPALADMPTTSFMFEGAAVHNGTHMCMPEVDVGVNITRTGNAMNTSMRADFHLATDVPQNAMLGIILPTYFSYKSNAEYYLSIQLNDTDVDYSILPWFGLGIGGRFSTELADELGYWLLNADYAALNLELQANSTAVITVISRTWQDLEVNSIEYTYVVVGAPTFEGDTRAVVHMQLVENTPFLGSQFEPDINLNVNKEGIVTDAIWNFNVSEFDDVSVRMHAEVNEYHPALEPIDLFWLLFFAGLIAVILVPVIVKTADRRR